MLRLAAEENRIEKDKQSELDATVKKLSGELERLKAEKPHDKSLQPTLHDLTELAVRATAELRQLRQANTAVDDALRRGAAVTTMGSSLFSGQQGVVVQPQGPVGQQTFVHPVVPGGHQSTDQPTVRVAEKPNATSRSE
jgi:hypothetical protein